MRTAEPCNWSFELRSLEAPRHHFPGSKNHNCRTSGQFGTDEPGTIVSIYGECRFDGHKYDLPACIAVVSPGDSFSLESCEYLIEAEGLKALAITDRTKDLPDVIQAEVRLDLEG